MVLENLQRHETLISFLNEALIHSTAEDGLLLHNITACICGYIDLFKYNVLCVIIIVAYVFL